jgi:large subunit ribosomal protein L6
MIIIFWIASVEDSFAMTLERKMSRVAKKPINLPAGVEATLDGQTVTIKGKKGVLKREISSLVKVAKNNNSLQFEPTNEETADSTAGATRALVQNMVVGVSEGFERKLDLVGIGYRAQAQGKKLNLTLGYSHPINFPVPEGITIETPSQTEIIIKGIDKQLVGQTAAKIRDLRSPEPYKGKGVRYHDEVVILKEAKKK